MLRRMRKSALGQRRHLRERPPEAAVRKRFRVGSFYVSWPCPRSLRPVDLCAGYASRKESLTRQGRHPERESCCCEAGPPPAPHHRERGRGPTARRYASVPSSLRPSIPHLLALLN